MIYLAGRLTILAVCVGVAGFLTSCATTAYKPAPYSVAPNRPYAITTPHTIHLVPCFDLIDDINRAHIDSSFDPSAYFTSMVESELSAAGVRHDRVSFAFVPTFEGVQSALRNGAQKDLGNLVLASSVNHFMSDRVVSCDFKLYSSAGDVIFEKRCLCLNFGAGAGLDAFGPQQAGLLTPAATRAASYDHLLAAHMLMQQLFADPDFQRALQ